MVSDGQMRESGMINMPWVEKYRPASLTELVSHQEITDTLMKLINENRLPHLLFYGPPGTGKTSTILAAARMLYTSKQLSSMVLELNASDDRGIGIVREQIINFAQTSTLNVDKNQSSVPKLIILDEADAMTKDAQSALRRVIEKFTDNVRFCIICNYLSKIIPAIQSRCTRLRFAPLSNEQILPRLHHIVQVETLTVTEDGQKALLNLAEGDMRRVINILQSTAMAFKTVDEPNVYRCVGYPLPTDVEKIVKILLNDSIEDAYTKIEEIRTERAFALSDILNSMHEFIFRLVVPPELLSRLLICMADIEYHLSQGCSDRLQLGALIGKMQNSGVGPNQPVYYQQTQGGAMMMGYPPSTIDQRQQQQVMNMQSISAAQIYSGTGANIQSMPGRQYSAGTVQESSPGIRPSSHSQSNYQLGVQSQTPNEQQQQQQQQQFQNRQSYQPQQQPQQCTQRISDQVGEKSKKDETKAARPMNPPPYSPEILSDLSKYSVASLACIGRELVQELLLRTYTLMTSLTKSVDRWHQQQGVSDPEQLLSYCEYILSKITEIRLRIDYVPRVANISEDEFITLMSDPSPPQKPPELTAKEETFEVQRRKLVKLNTALKNLDWMCLVSDPRFLKKADKN
uniref:Activator 1 subunit 5 n=1 Tax=Brugia malayi TaxID=6279 RepID=A0A1I9G4P3_BRUMA|nr:Bm4081, isoform g [Brugia malayi]